MVNTLMYLGCRADVNVLSWIPLTKVIIRKAVEQENLARNLVEVLYPNDNHIQGKELRLKQQYFFVSASVQRAVARL